MSVQVPQWRKMDNSSVPRHQELVDAVNENKQFVVDGELAHYATPSGKSLIDTRLAPFIVDRRIARIIAPESGGLTYTDARYRLQVLRAQRADVTGGSVLDTQDNEVFETEDDPAMYPEGGDNGQTGGSKDVGSKLTAINLAEIHDLDTSLTSSTHTTKEDGTVIVEVFCIYDREDPPNPHWFFTTGGAGATMLYARFINFAGNNLLTAHPCNIAGGSVDLAKTLYLMLTFPASIGNVPPFASFVSDVDVLGYFALPTGFAVTLSGHTVDGVLESFTQWPYVGKVGQVPQVTANNTSTLPAVIQMDYLTLHAIA